jgi:hypothetical protein
MTTPFAKIKRFAGLTIMAGAMAAAGLGLGAGTAQANTRHPCPPPNMVICTHIQTHRQRTDNFFDRVQGMFGVGEGTRFDNGFDRFFGAK